MAHTFTRRRFATLAAASAIGSAYPLRYARAAEFSFKWGTNVPESHPLNVHGRKAADALKEATNGRVELRLFPNNQLGGDADMFSQLRSGALECFTLSGVNVLSTLLPAAAISGVGFAFKDYPTLWKAMDGRLGVWLREQIGKTGLVVQEKIWDNGFRQVTTSTRPIVKPEDFQGLKIRVPVSALWTSLFQGLGASPTSLNFAEVYSALQTKVVDGQENPPAIISAAKLYEVQKYCSLTNHMWDGWWFLMNRRAWGQLPPDLQETFARVINAAAMAEREEVARQNDGLKAELAAKGLIFNAVEPEPFRATLSQAGFYKTWKAKFGPEAWAILEESTGPLA
ncbi:TRAP transporter substrate-binding protein [Methylobacterium sp. NEAU 140]|uniref:TRAP transporter substrate-binding protein n=1 Tax=Methylobacterium sp. NEAU 140 TaxID=3064945 RepID=UPI002733515E|nr:TRAP transporter substrate-binding protein [Methylobacterium sp. NEAU 140]MDP4022975.1 TRAP transporter substrate-binding protein [Methylobacterium sp. NEAU 140]